MPRRRAWLAAVGVALVACEAAPPAATDPSASITPLAIEDVVVERADGSPIDLREVDAPLLLHFWASWCAPCRRELPALIEAAREQDARVLAVSADSGWSPVRAFFDGAPPREVVRDPSGALARALGVGSLPDTYLVDGEGRAIRRIAGALDWSAPEHRAWLARTVAGGHGSTEE